MANQEKAAHFSLIDKNYKFTVIPTRVEEQALSHQPVSQGGANDVAVSASQPVPNTAKVQHEKNADNSSRAFPKVDSANDISKLPSVNVVFRRLSLALDGESIERKLNSSIAPPGGDNAVNSQIITQKTEDAKAPEERSCNNNLPQ